MKKQKNNLPTVVGESAEIVIQGDQHAPESSPEALISLAITKGVDVATLERLVALKEKVDAKNAKIEYDDAMAKFQSECPVIKKGKVVLEKDKQSVRYKYAPLDSIVDQTKEIIAKHGLSYTIRTESDDKFLSAICRVTHTAGHSEDFSFKVPIGNEQYMSDVQKYGARLTFAKRYAFCNAFGILTGDDDDDAQSTKSGNSEPSRQSNFERLLKLVGKSTRKELHDYREKIEKSDKYTEEQKAMFLKAVDGRLLDLKGDPVEVEIS